MLAVLSGIRHDESERDEEAPFHENDADGGERKAWVAEYLEVGPLPYRELGPSSWRQARFDEEVGWDGESEHDEGENSATPGKSESGEELPQDQREDDAPHAAGGGGNAGCKAAAFLEVVADGGIGGRVQKRASYATEDGVCEDDLVVCCCWSALLNMKGKGRYAYSHTSSGSEDWRR